MRAVKVTWMDAYAIYGWRNEGEIDEWAKETENFTVITVGYVYQETGEWIVLHRGMNGVGGLMDPLLIQQSSIISIEELTNA